MGLQHLSKYSVKCLYSIPTAVPDEMKKLLSQLAESLHLHPPNNGGINVKKLSEAGHSPPVLRRSSADELLPKSSRGKSQHSISQPILV